MGRRVNKESPPPFQQVVARRMISDSISGSIVNVSSQASLAGLDQHTVYSATKGAMDAASKVMAVEFGEWMESWKLISSPGEISVGWVDGDKGRPRM